MCPLKTSRISTDSITRTVLLLLIKILLQLPTKTVRFLIPSTILLRVESTATAKLPHSHRNSPQRVTRTVNLLELKATQLLSKSKMAKSPQLTTAIPTQPLRMALLLPAILSKFKRRLMMAISPISSSILTVINPLLPLVSLSKDPPLVISYQLLISLTRLLLNEVFIGDKDLTKDSIKL